MTLLGAFSMAVVYVACMLILLSLYLYWIRWCVEHIRNDKLSLAMAMFPIVVLSLVSLTWMIYLI